jgi:hypothetical protein
MNWHQEMAGESPELEQALRHFKASMDAWSDATLNNAVLSRPRMTAQTAVRHTWRMAASWALGCLLAAGSLAGAVHEIYHRQEMARLAAQQAAQKAAEERAAAARDAALRASAQVNKSVPVAATLKDDAGAQDEDLLATVDSDVSREVPAAMEPLAQLMDENGTQ